MRESELEVAVTSWVRPEHQKHEAGVLITVTWYLIRLLCGARSKCKYGNEVPDLRCTVSWPHRQHHVIHRKYMYSQYV